MKICSRFLTGTAAGLLGLAATGCQEIHPNYTTSPYHPGPVVGQAVGTGAGVVAGNVAGAAVGLGEGAVRGAAEPFDPTARVVRRWHTETTPDGRMVQVPQDILVDAYGRPVGPAPAGASTHPPLASPKNQ